jgi:hypothetical protein
MIVIPPAGIATVASGMRSWDYLPSDFYNTCTFRKLPKLRRIYFPLI